MKVRAYMTLMELFGWREKIVELDKDKPKFKDLIKKIPDISIAMKRYKGERWSLIILLNGRHLNFLGNEEALLKDGDIITLFPPLAGG